MESSPGAGAAHDFQEPGVPAATWHIPPSKQTIEIWQPATGSAATETVDRNATSGLYELHAVDFSQPTDSVRKSDEFPKQENVSDRNNQTVTLFDLNQNHETKVLVTDVPVVDCDSQITSPDDEESASLSSSSACDGLGSTTPCAVCGDKSSGKHYGQQTCEGCKSFFKRSVRRNLSYTCRGNRDCAIDPQHRNQCQYCRLRKCINAGMRKEAVQRGRINPAAAHMEYPYGMPPVIPGVDAARLNTCYSSNFISALLRAEPYSTTSLQQGAPVIAAPGDGVYEVTARLFYTAVEWARNIPFFAELHPVDQMNLLRSCWAELFVLNTSQCCTPIYFRSLLAAVSSSVAESRYDAGNEELIRQLLDQLYKLSVLRLDAPEYCCLKALVLFSTDAPGLHDPNTIQNIQEKVLFSLEEYDRIQHSNQLARSGHLLLRLPGLKLINPNLVENLFFSNQLGKTPIDNVIKDMLVGGNNFWIPSTDQTGTTPNSSHSAASMPQL